MKNERNNGNKYYARMKEIVMWKDIYWPNVNRKKMEVSVNHL
jgi:hypothetical protein